jgi:hypothetical protein
MAQNIHPSACQQEDKVMRTPQAAGLASAGPATAEVLEPTSAPHPRSITDITVEHGPVDVLGRIFLIADSAARERGVSLSFGSFEELLQANEKNRNSWGIMTSMYDYRCCPHGLAPERAFCLFGRDTHGEVVTTHAVRLYELGECSMREMGDRMLLHHDDPDLTKQPQESIEVTAPSAESIRGRLVINGAVWFHPNYRKRQLSMIIPRAVRAYAYTMWKPDWCMGLMMEGPTGGGVIETAGYPYREWGLQIRNAQNGSPRCCLAWMHASELLADLRGYLAGFTTQVDAGVHQRRAQNQR